jgi:hypothetical protein
MEANATLILGPRTWRTVSTPCTTMKIYFRSSGHISRSSWPPIPWAAERSSFQGSAMKLLICTSCFDVRALRIGTGYGAVDGLIGFA